jgi:hypothetical protein
VLNFLSKKAEEKSAFRFILICCLLLYDSDKSELFHFRLDKRFVFIACVAEGESA